MQSRSFDGARDQDHVVALTVAIAVVAAVFAFLAEPERQLLVGWSACPRNDTTGTNSAEDR